MSIACRSAHKRSTPPFWTCSIAARGPTTSGTPCIVYRDAGIDNRSLDLIYGIPGQTPADLARDLDEALALEPEHLSAYELEAKPGTRFTHAHGAELLRQADELESYIEQVVERLTAAGYRWYETANFCRLPDRAGGRDLRARHNLGYWLGHDYLGLGVGAVSTIENRRWRNAPSLHRYLAAHARGERPEREMETLSAGERATERRDARPAARRAAAARRPRGRRRRARRSTAWPRAGWPCTGKAP